jgi:hypothetical protein
MNKATMFAVGILMIAMLVGLGASAEAPLDDGCDDSSLEKMAKGRFMEAEDPTEHSHPLWGTDWNVVGSRGGAYTCVDECPDPEEPLPKRI